MLYRRNYFDLHLRMLNLGSKFNLHNIFFKFPSKIIRFGTPSFLLTKKAMVQMLYKIEKQFIGLISNGYIVNDLIFNIHNFDYIFP